MPLHFAFVFLQCSHAILRRMNKFNTLSRNKIGMIPRTSDISELHMVAWNIVNNICLRSWSSSLQHCDCAVPLPWKTKSYPHYDFVHPTFTSHFSLTTERGSVRLRLQAWWERQRMPSSACTFDAWAFYPSSARGVYLRHVEGDIATESQMVLRKMCVELED